MAIRRPRPRSSEIEHLGPVMIDRQDLRDLMAIFERLRGEAASKYHQERPVSILVNDYEADQIEDVFVFDRTVHEVALSAPDLSVHLSLSSTNSLLLWDRDIDHAKAAADEIRAILDPRTRKYTRSLAQFVLRLAAVLAVAAIVALGGGLILRALDLDTPFALGAIAGEVVFLIGMYVRVFRWITSPASRRSLFIEDGASQPFWRRYETELMLIMTALAVIVPIVVALSVEE